MPVRQLSEATVNRIAAGEVVERPASVVKELVENALDAGATRIEVATDGGGRRFIRVIDDGEGMTRERSRTRGRASRNFQARRRGSARHPHAWLSRRGFAVDRCGRPPEHHQPPSVGAACLGAERERRPKSPVKPSALDQGTRVELRDLFYATPARLKFLKTDRTEAEAVRDVVRRLAMSRPDVAFTLTGEERAPVTWAAALPGPTGRLARLADILGPEFRANAVEIRAGREGLMIEGFAALPTLNRANTLGQYLFVNGRPVRDKLLLGALRGAYADYLPRDRHPLVALFITQNPREVDVNVHPAKTEVRFRDGGLVRGLLVSALKEALARDSRRAATTGGSATIAAFRPAADAALGLAAIASAAGDPRQCGRLRRSRADRLSGRRADGGCACRHRRARARIA